MAAIEGLSVEAQKRLQKVESWRRQNEMPYRCGRERPKRTSTGVGEAISATETNRFSVSGVPLPVDPEQNEEMAFIFQHFAESRCAEFKPLKRYRDNDPRVCDICGLTEEFHDDGNNAFDNLDGLAVSLPATPLRSRASAADSTCGGDNRDSVILPSFNGLLEFGRSRMSQPGSAAGDSGGCPSLTSPRVGSSRQLPVSTCGLIFIPQRFIKSDSGRREPCRKYVRFDAESATMSDVWKLLTNKWKLKHPSLVLSVTGGIMAEMDPYMKKCLSATIYKLVYNTDAWIISDGRNFGASRFLGQLLVEGSEDAALKDDDFELQHGDPVLIGINHWGTIRRKKLLFGVSLPGTERGSQYFYSMEYQLARDEHPRILSPHQSAYLLLDNGKRDQGKCVDEFRSKLDGYLQREAASKIYTSKEVRLPVVTLVLGGDGLRTLECVLDSINSERPVVVVKGTSRIPTLLAEMFYALEDKLPRTWNSNAVWDSSEERTFQSYVKRFSNKIREIFHVAHLDTDVESEYKRKDIRYELILTTLRQIMEKRYFFDNSRLRARNWTRSLQQHSSWNLQRVHQKEWSGNCFEDLSSRVPRGIVPSQRRDEGRSAPLHHDVISQ
jgi:hypothetical protein